MIDPAFDRDVQERARGALVGLAIGDALGAPVEFKPRGSFPEVREMRSGGYFRLPAGAWTDDTAMALCLSDCFLSRPEFDEKDLLDRFLRWIDDNENTSTGRCIGVGQNTMAVLGNYRRTGAIVPRQHQWRRFDVVVLGVFWFHRSDEGTKMRPKHSGQLKASAERVVEDIQRATRRRMLPETMRGFHH